MVAHKKWSSYPILGYSILAPSSLVRQPKKNRKNFETQVYWGSKSTQKRIFTSLGREIFSDFQQYVLSLLGAALNWHVAAFGVSLAKIRDPGDR